MEDIARMVHNSGFRRFYAESLKKTVAYPQNLSNGPDLFQPTLGIRPISRAGLTL